MFIFGVTRGFAAAAMLLAAELGNARASEKCAALTDKVNFELAAMADAARSFAPREELKTRLDLVQSAFREEKECAASTTITLPRPKKVPDSGSPTRPSLPDLTSRLDRTHRSVPTPSDDEQLGAEYRLEILWDELSKPHLNYHALQLLVEQLRNMR